MWKKTLLSLLFITPYSLANQPSSPPEKTWTSAEITAMKQAWQQEQQGQEKARLAARRDFLQFENLIQQALKQGKVSTPLLQLATELAPKNYPLQEEIAWLLLSANIANANPDNVEQLVAEILAFSEKYPNTAKRNQLNQRPFSLYFEHQKFDALLQYAEKVPPTSVENQCRVLNLKGSLFTQSPINESLTNQTLEQDKHLQAFEALWQNATTSLPNDCNLLAERWANKGLNTIEKYQQKAVSRFTKNQSLADITHSDETLTAWLADVERLRTNPQHLQNFAENQPLDPWNKAIVQHAFLQFIKSQPELIGETEFSQYQRWAEKFQLSKDELNAWKIAFLNRAFDNPAPEFQTWRDTLLTELRVDTLTERRLRMAIWQKTDLKPWLDLLSNESKNKQEWRYWLAKNDAQAQTKLLTELSHERGFYPMLAAHALGKSYQITLPQTPALNDEQLTNFHSQLARIAELRQLRRFEQAKLVWIELLQAVNFEQKLALSHYALNEEWYDLAVEGTIQAKAWDYIPLRLPNAYVDWFKLNLKDKSISQTFAMAIARQESAWNPQARSHANAIGLMQMLPSTAKQTATQQQLPFSGENDLLQPFNNIMLGTAHLAELNEKYPNNRILIAAAYNAGPHRVTKWLERANGTLAMDEFIASIPFFETRGYVQNVLAYDYYYQQLQAVPTPILFTKEEQRTY